MIKNYFWYFSNALTDEQCDKIINLGLSKKIEEATTLGNTQKSNKRNFSLENKTIQSTVKELRKKKINEKKINKFLEEKSYIRDSNVCWLSDRWLYDLILPYVNTANENAGWKYDLNWTEDLQFTIYKPGGFYGWHIDGESDWNAAYVLKDENTKKTTSKNLTNCKNYVGMVRKLSVTINLSSPEDYIGGDLKFDFGEHQKNKFKTCDDAKKRGTIVVFPSFVYHQVTPIKKGTRYSLVAWVLGKPFR